MGVYLCLGEAPHKLHPKNAKPFSYYNSFANIHEQHTEEQFIFVFLGKGAHKIKKKAEQEACLQALKILAS